MTLLIIIVLSLLFVVLLQLEHMRDERDKNKQKPLIIGQAIYEKYPNHCSTNCIYYE